MDDIGKPSYANQSRHCRWVCLVKHCPCGVVSALSAPSWGAKSHVFVLAIKSREALPLRVGPADGKKPLVLTLSPEELTAIKLSLRVATWATIVSLPFG